MNIAYGKLLEEKLEENEKLRAEIQVLKESNELLVTKLNARLQHPTPSLQEMADQMEIIQKECELYRQRFVWALTETKKTLEEMPKDEELPFILKKQAN
jgi:hypothetical protein